MTGDDDLAARLDRNCEQPEWLDIPGLLGDAAREIRRLRAEVDRLRAVVPPMNLNVRPASPHPGRIS